VADHDRMITEHQIANGGECCGQVFVHCASVMHQEIMPVWMMGFAQ
jgi:hypothetical protein